MTTELSVLISMSAKNVTSGLSSEIANSLPATLIPDAKNNEIYNSRFTISQSLLLKVSNKPTHPKTHHQSVLRFHHHLRYNQSISVLL